MNVLLHVAAGTAIIAGHAHLNNNKLSDRLILAASGFVLGLMAHGILDYVPHCYPINSKWDASLGLLFIIMALWRANTNWKLIIALTYGGSIFPDLVDLAPGIINDLLGTHIPIVNKVFPWHFHEYSGSIYSDQCNVSSINHILTLLFCGLIIGLNRRHLRNIMVRD